MDLVERIETTRFLGAEFLVWLWFCSETFETRLQAGDVSVELWLDSPLTLESQLEPGERVTLRGVAPASAAEAKEALRQNKLPTKARLVLRHDPHEFVWTLDAATLALTSARIPALLSQNADEAFLERMRLLDSLSAWVDCLFADFLRVRLAAGWSAQWVPAMASWMQEQPLTTAQLRQLAARRKGGTESVQGPAPGGRERAGARRR